jgi:hypothetical protein
MTRRSPSLPPFPFTRRGRPSPAAAETKARCAGIGWKALSPGSCAGIAAGATSGLAFLILAPIAKRSLRFGGASAAKRCIAERAGRETTEAGSHLVYAVFVPG